MYKDLEKCLANKGIIQIIFHSPEITGYVARHTLSDFIDNEDDGSIDIWVDKDYSFTLYPDGFEYDEVEDMWVGNTMSIRFEY